MLVRPPLARRRRRCRPLLGVLHAGCTGASASPRGIGRDGGRVAPTNSFETSLIRAWPCGRCPVSSTTRRSRHVPCPPCPRTSQFWLNDALQPRARMPPFLGTDDRRDASARAALHHPQVPVATGDGVALPAHVTGGTDASSFGHGRRVRCLCTTRGYRSQRGRVAPPVTSTGHGHLFLARPGHRRLRAQWARRVQAGVVKCARCGELIAPDEPFDLGHVDGTLSYAGAEHARCNRATSSHRVERKGWLDPTSRIW